MCKYLTEEAAHYRIHIFELVDASLLLCRKSQMGKDYQNSDAANPSKGKVFRRNDSNILLTQPLRASQDSVLKLLPTVVPITLPIMDPAANSENQWIVTETANPT